MAADAVHGHRHGMRHLPLALVLLLVPVAGCGGCNGDRGPSGAEGPAGPAGAQGLSGAAGPAGVQGPAGPAGPGSTTNGTRISAHAITTPDGLRAPTGTYHDSQLAADCAFAAAADGMLRCLPGGAQAWPLWNGAGTGARLFYADAACSTPPALFIADGTTGVDCNGKPVPVQVGGYAQTRHLVEACGGTEVLTIGAAMATAPAAVWTLAQGGADGGSTSCLSEGAPPSGGTFYGATIVDPSTLAAGTIQ